MKTTTISAVNAKGQIVIPAAIRDQLGITSEMPLVISLEGKTISIVPVKKIITIEDHNSYADALKKTQGAWENEPQDRDTTERELAASQRRKTAW